MFDDVDWERRAACLKGKPEMYQLWLSKQSTDFCATGINMGRWFRTVTSCPNCSSCPAVTVDHLFCCKDVGRTKLFEDVVIALEDWMEANYTDPWLARIKTYEALPSCAGLVPSPFSHHAQCARLDDAIFINQLFHITHSQWIYCNISKHHSMHGPC
jgi:hypothetical protein